MVTEFTNSPATTIHPVAPTKFTDLATSAKAKQDNYFQKVEQKLIQRDQAIAEKRLPTTAPLSETDLSSLATWKYNNEFDKAFSDSLDRNHEAWFDNTSFTGRAANLFLGFGTAAIADVAMKIYTAPIAAVNAMERASVPSEDYDRARQLHKKYKDGTPLSPADVAWGATEAFQKAGNLVAREHHIREVDELGMRIKSVVNRLDTDMTTFELTQSNIKSLKQFKSGDYLDGVVTYLGGLTDLAIKSPGAAMQFVAESGPYMLAMAAAPIAGITVSALDINERAVQDFYKEYDEMPNPIEQFVAGTASVISAAFDAIGAKFTVGGKGTLKGLMKLAKAAGVRIPKASLKGAAGVLARSTSTSVKSLGVEGGTESVQNLLEQYAGKQDVSKLDPIPAMTEGQIGAISGLGMSSPRMAADVATYKERDAQEVVEETVTKKVETFKKTKTGKKLKKPKTSGLKAAVKLKALLQERYSTGEELTDAAEEVAGAVIKEPTPRTPAEAKVLVKLLDEIGHEALPKETKTLVEDLAKIEKVEPGPGLISRLIKSIKAGAQELPVFEPSEKKYARGVKKNDPELMLKGLKDYRVSKMDLEEKTDYMDKTYDAIVQFQKVVSEMPDGPEKSLKLRDLQKHADRYTELATIEVKRDTADLDREINEAFDDKKSFGKALKEKILFSAESYNSMSVEQAQKALKNPAIAGDKKASAILTSYIDAQSISEVSEQVNKGGGFGAQSRGLGHYRREMDAAIAGSRGNPKAADDVLLRLVVWHKFQQNKKKNGLIGAPDVVEQARVEARNIGLTAERLKGQYYKKFGEEFRLDIKTAQARYKEMVQDARLKQGKPVDPVSPGQPKTPAKSKTETVAVKKAPAIPKEKKVEPPKSVKPVEETKTAVVEEVEEKTSEPVKKEKERKLTVKEKILEEYPDPIDEVNKNLKYYFVTLTSIVREKLLSDKNLDTVKGALKSVNFIRTSMDKGENGNDLSTSVRIIGVTKKALSLVPRAKAAKIAAQLRNKLFTNSIKITGTGKASRWSIPASLHDIMVPETGETKNIFQRVPDLFSNLKEKLGESIGLDYDKLNGPQRQVLKGAQKMYNKFNETLNGKNSILLAINPERLEDKRVPFDASILEDLTNYFIQEKKDPETGEVIRYLDPNLVGALTTVGFEWLGTMGTNTLVNSPEDMQRILHRSPDETPATAVSDVLQFAGGLRTGIEKIMGPKVLKLAELIPNPDRKNKKFHYLIPQLELAMGQLVVSTMLELGYLKENPIVLDTLLGKTEANEFNDDGTPLATKFIRIPSSKVELSNMTKPKARGDIETLTKDMSESKGIMQEVFGVEGSEIWPSMEKPKIGIIRKVKRSFQIVTGQTNDSLDHQSQKEHKINKGVFSIFSLFDEKDQIRMGGEKETEGLHTTEAKRVSAKNDLLAREVKNYNRFITKLGINLNKVFYYTQEVWGSGRVGMVSNMVNPLFSKIHRHLVTMPEWDSELNMLVPDERKGFVLALAQSFGISTDKDTFETLDGKVDALLKDSAIVYAVKAIQRLNNPKTRKRLTKAQLEEHKQNILGTVEWLGEGYHSLQGLVELAKASQHISEASHRINLKNTFVTNLPYEIDGKTNGIAFSLMQVGFDGLGKITKRTNALLNACGIMTGVVNNSIEWSKGVGNWDVYQTITKAVNKLVDSTGLTEQVLGRFIGDITDLEGDGRKFSKTAVIAFVFGAGKKALKRSVFDSILGRIYSQLATYHLKTAAEIASDPDAQQFIADIRFLTKDKRFEIPIGDCLKYEFDESTLDIMREYSDGTYGNALADALDDTFSGIVKYREAMNQAATVMFEAFMMEFTERVKKVKAQFKFNDGFEHDLSVEQERKILQELREILPSFEGPNSKTIEDSILALTIERTRDYKNGFNQQKYSRPITNSEDAETKTPSMSSKSTVDGRDFKDLGIKALMRNMHNMDSVVQQDLMLSFPIWNVHDATIGSIKDMMARGKASNKVFLERNMSYHGLEAMYLRMEEILSHKLIQKHIPRLDTLIKNDKRTFANIKNPNPKKPATVVDLKYVRDMVYRRLQASAEARDQIFAYATYIDQYVGHQSTYQNTHANEFGPHSYDVAVGKLQSTNIPPELLAALEDFKEKSLGSSESSTAEDNFNSIYSDDIDLNAQNTQQLFEDMEYYGNTQENAEHRATLQDVLTNVINTVITPAHNLTFRLQQKGHRNEGRIEDTRISLTVGRGYHGSNTPQSAQEILVHELVHGITRAGLQANYAIQKKVATLMKAAAKVVTPEDFLNHTTNDQGQRVPVFWFNEKAERENAQRHWDYIFNNKDGNSLYEFVAYGLTNQAVKDKLAGAIMGDRKKAVTLFDRLNQLWESIQDFFTNKFYKLKGQSMDNALMSLVQELTTVKDTNVGMLRSVMDATQVMDDKVISIAEKFIFKPWNDLYDAKLFGSRRKRDMILGLPIALHRAIKTDEFGLVMRQWRRNLGFTEDNILMQLIREVTVGTNKYNGKWHKLMRDSKKLIDQLRKRISTKVENYIKDGFHTEYSTETSKVLFRTLIKTNISSIFTQYGGNIKERPALYEYNYTQLIEILNDEKKLNDAIYQLQKSIFLDDKAGGRYSINQANGLGYWMATGRAAIRELNLNAFNIYSQDGVAEKSRKDPADPKGLQKRIDALATLFALKYTTNDNKTAAALKIAQEFEHKDGKETNGITRTLDVSKHIREDSRENLFLSDHLMVKNYSSLITNPNTGVKIAGIEQEAEFKKDGYIRIKELGDFPLSKDKRDPNRSKKMYLYVTKENSLIERMRTIVSTTSMQVSGFTVKDILQGSGDKVPHLSVKKETRAINAANQEDIQIQFTELLGDLSKVSENYMVPVRNDKGGTANYRYQMTDQVKVNELEQDERLERVLGVTAASISDKVESAGINERVVDMAYDDYLEHYDNEPEAYKLISLESPDGEKYQELYKLLPKAMQDYMKTKWGSKRIYVREEMVNTVFGYRKASLYNATLFDKQIGHSINDAMLGMANFVGKLSPRIHYTGTLPLKALEAKVQDLVGLVKDLIVVKSGSVLLGNSISNTILLIAKGISPSKAVKLQSEAYRAIENYHQDLINKETLELQLDSETMTAAKRRNLEAKVENLKHTIEINPASKLVVEGVFQSIVEDIELDKNIYNTSSKIAAKAEEWGDEHLNEYVMKGAKQGWMAKDTKSYKTMFKLTQYGDFVSRYALYKHRVEEVEKAQKDPSNTKYDGITAEEIEEGIIDEVIETFINYDIPTSPEMQYMNDMGFMMFTKFLFRIQRIIFKTIKEKPATSAILMSLRAMLSSTVGIDLSYITDSYLWGTILNRFSNPINVMLNLLGIPLINVSTGL